MRWSSNILPSERLAITLFALLLASTFVYEALYRWLWVIGIAPIFLLYLIALILALFHVVFAFSDDHRDITQRLRSAIAIPLAIASAMVLHQLVAIGPRSAASLHLATHADEMRAAQRAAGPGRAAAIRYVEGVPDGGTAIIRSPHVRPDRLPVAEQVRLTGERIHGCRSIVGAAYACGFD